MDSFKGSKEKQNKSNNNFMNNLLFKIRSKYILSKILSHLKENMSLEIIKYSKKIQNRLNISLNDYQNFNFQSEIEVEIIPAKIAFAKFINFLEPKDKEYCHIYFDKSKGRIITDSVYTNSSVSKITIIIGPQVKSFYKLFYECDGIESINFKKFFRANIYNMSYMFSYCHSLKEVTFSKFNTNNVIDMNHMFSDCYLLKK